MAVAALATAACQRPGWTDPAKSRSPHVLRAAKTAPARVVPVVRRPPPPPPAWARPMLGRPLETLAPRLGACLGNPDMVMRRFGGGDGGSEVFGWAWDVGRKDYARRVVLTDASGRVIGAGDGGLSRPDVHAAIAGVTSDLSGWTATTPRVAGHVEAYAMVEGGEARCRLGALEL